MSGGATSRGVTLNLPRSPAAAFALTHGIAQGIPIFFIIGLGLALLRSRSGSIYPAMILHICFNGFGIITGVFT